MRSPQDLSEFDLIVGMDADNIAAVRRAAEHWRAQPATAAGVPLGA